MGIPSAIDLILNNANIITCDPKNPRAEALAIKGDRILLIGTDKEMEPVKASANRVLDCQRKTLIPGFNDAHCHIFSLVRKLFSLDLGPKAVRSIEDIKEVICRKVRLSPEGRWINCTDYNEFYLAEKRHPTRLDLDEAAPRHPVILTHRSLHAVVLNSLALKLVGITNETEEPEGGIIDRDLKTGEPNGILFEMLDYIRSKINAPISETELDWGISEVNREYLSQGITSIGEATATNDIEQWLTFKKLKQARKLKSRVNMMLGTEALSEFKGIGLATGSGDNHLRVGSLKIILSQATGDLLPAQEELNQKILGASRAGFQVAIHAVERDAVESATLALEYLQNHFRQMDQRHRIEHCSECPPDLRERLKHLQAVIVSQPPFIYYSGERYLAQVPTKTQSWLYPFKSLLESDLIVAGSSDSPVVSNNPLMGIYAAVTRKAESGQSILAAEAVSARQALEMYTRNAAFATFEENIKGTLSPGKLADIVMLSIDPLKASPDQLKDIGVEMTIVGGEIVFENN